MGEWIIRFFEDESDMMERINLFGKEHILLLSLTLGAALLLFSLRGKLREWRNKENVRYWMAGLFSANMLAFYVVLFMKGSFDWRTNLPLHLCFLSNIFFIFVLFTGNRRLFRVAYFFTWIGPLPAILFPNTPVHFDHFLTYQFFISHHLLLLTGLYCLWILGYQVGRSDLPKAFFAGNGVFLYVYAFNQVFGTNYIMTGEIPAHILMLFPFLKSFNHPLLLLEVCGLAGLLLAYVPVWLVHRRRESVSQPRTQLHTRPQEGRS